MIYTITFSPSIDYVINAKDFKNDSLNRIEDYNFVPGGKGINASIILNRIGIKNKAITFLGGQTKSLFLNLIKKEKIKLSKIKVEENTRINVKYITNKNSFEINGKKPIIDDTAKKKFLKLISKLNHKDVVLIMGISDDDFLIEILKILDKNKIKFVLDIDSKNMINFIKYKPFLIKPNWNELESILNKKINNINELKNNMLFLKEKGCKNILVSNGKEGSYFIDDKNNFYEIKIKKVNNVVSPIGAGDTLISSLTAFILNNLNIEDALLKATSLSIGTVKTKFLAKKEDIDKYKNLITISKTSCL